MVTNGLMILLLIALVFICFWNIKYECDREHYFNIKDTSALRGIFSIVVVLVHVPLNYQNTVQDMIGSFAYVGVTYYFMVSSYGLKYSYVKKENYLKSFWSQRIPKLLIPVFLVNFVYIFSELLAGNTVLNLRTVFHINDWVMVLFLFYGAFWLIYSIPCSNNRIEWCWQDVVICIFVLACSLVDKLTVVKITQIWPTECMGFMWGIILYNSIGWLKKYINNKWLMKIFMVFVIAIVIGIAYLKFKHVFFWGDYCLKIVLGIVLLSLLLGLLIRLDVSNNVNLFLGKISYEVYLLHSYIFAIVAFLGGDKIESGIFIWISIIVTIILALGIHSLSNWIYKGIENILLKLTE